jgi:hypothetical protein
MVKIFIIIVLLISGFKSKSQISSIESGIELSACFSKDSVYFGESFKIILFYKNITETNIVFSPEAIIGISHYHPDKFISYDTPKRIIFRINNHCSNNQEVDIKSNETFVITYDIKADSNFFYGGENTVLVFYHLYDKSLKDTRRTVDKRKPVLSLWSPPIKIYLCSKDCFLEKRLVPGY